MTTAHDAHTLQSQAKAATLIEALPYLQRYAGQTFVVKYGGHAMGDEQAARDFAQDVVLLKAVGINPVVVHGGGPQIGAMLAKLGVTSEFVDGLRVTDKATAEIAEMVLSGAINKQLVGWLTAAGGKALGISGKDGGLVSAAKLRRTRRDPDQQYRKRRRSGLRGGTCRDRHHLDRYGSGGGHDPRHRPDRGRRGRTDLQHQRRHDGGRDRGRRWGRRGCSC